MPAGALALLALLAACGGQRTQPPTHARGPDVPAVDAGAIARDAGPGGAAVPPPRDLGQAPTAELETACAADHGVGGACLDLASRCLEGRDDLERDPGRAIVLLHTACTAGDLDGCRFLGLVYVEGLANPVLPYNEDAWREGMKIWEAACAKGHGHSCASAGERYESNFPLPADPGKARALKARACKLGYTDACPTLPR